MSGVRYNSGRKRYLGPLLELELPIKLDPAQYTGSIVYANDGAIYYSNGVDWVIPVDRVPIARPVALSPTTPTQQAQLRLNAYFSAIDIPQTGTLFEVSLTESFTDPLFTRLLEGEGIFQYQMEYPEDGLEPGDIFYWRGRYIGGTEQSAFSLPIQQTFPELIAEPIQITPAGSVQGAVTISDYESPFGLIFVQSEIEFYDATGNTLLETVTDTTFGLNQFTIPSTLTEGTTYTWRARRGGKIGIDGATQFSPWTGKRAVINGARSVVLTYDADLMSALTIGVPLSGTVDCTIDWGDGSSDAYTTAGVKTHTYAGGTTGTVTVTISGTLTVWGGQAGITAAQQQGLTRVESIGFQLGLVSLERAFQNTSVNLTYIAPEMPPDITNMSRAFQGSATQADLRTLNVSNITNMSFMFYLSTGIGPQIEGWDVSKVTTAEGMFSRSKFNRPFDNCNWIACTNMAYMFGSDRDIGGSTVDSCAFNQPINGWNVSNVTDMSYMFGYRKGGTLGTGNGGIFTSNFNQTLSNWNVSSVTNMEGMFGAFGVEGNNSYSYTGLFNQPLNTWNTSNVTNMRAMFGFGGTFGSFAFNQNLTNWNVTKVTSMQEMFRGNDAFAGDISTWSCAVCTNMFRMFSRNARGNGSNPILQVGSSVWQTPEVTTTSEMFQNNASFNRNISLWKLPKCTDISGMFSNTASGAGATPILQSGSNVWETPVATNASSLFRLNETFNNPLSLWDTSSITNMFEMFESASTFNQPIGDWDVSNVTNMSKMFSVNAASRSIDFNQDIGSWDVSNVTDMSYMFGAFQANSGNREHFFNNGGSDSIKDWDTSSVTNMQQMFGVNTSTTSNMGSYFNQPIGSWDVSNVTNMIGMFAIRNAVSTFQVIGSKFNQDISAWQLNSNVVLTNFMAGPAVPGAGQREFDSTNYSKLLAGWANYISPRNGPYTQTVPFTAIQYTDTTIAPGERFTTGEDGRTFLTTSRSVIVSSATDPDADGVYSFDPASGVYTNINDWFFLKTGGSWKLYDDAEVLQATGTGDVATPWQSSAWDGDLTSADVLNNGVAWTITDGGLV